MLDLSYLNSLAKPLLDFFNNSKITDLGTLAAAAALLLTAVDFYKQKKEFPARKLVGLLAVFFFCDGMDYAVYVMAAANDSAFFDLLGVGFDIAVTISAILILFNVSSNKRKDK